MFEGGSSGMKLKNKQILSIIMIFGDLFMALVAFALMMEDMPFIGGLMLLFLGVDIYLTIDYIRALKHREKVEQSLLSDNQRLREVNTQWNQLRRRPKERRRTAETEEEDDLSDVLTARQEERNQSMHG